MQSLKKALWNIWGMILLISNQNVYLKDFFSLILRELCHSHTILLWFFRSNFFNKDSSRIMPLKKI